MRARLLPLAGLALALWLVLPLVPLAVWSAAHGWRFPDLLPSAWTLDGWRYALSAASGVPQSLGLSVGIAAAAAALSLAIGLPAARALGLHRFRGRGAVELAMLAPIIVPGIAVAMGLHGLFLRLGLTGGPWGVILVHLVPTLPYAVLVLAAVFAAHDTRMEEQARSLGASPARVLWHVTLPALAPGIAAAGLLAFLVSWSQYALTLVIGGGRVVTLPLLLFNFATSGRPDIAGAIGMIYMAPGLVLILFTGRYLTGRGAALAGVRP